jgi:hypothetical protein
MRCNMFLSATGRANSTVTSRLQRLQFESASVSGSSIDGASGKMFIHICFGAEVWATMKFSTATSKWLDLALGNLTLLSETWRVPQLIHIVKSAITSIAT